jgi:chemotaxis methyl-accepting protein methylase
LVAVPVPKSIRFCGRFGKPDLKILPVGIDGSGSAIEQAKVGRYARQSPELRNMNDQLLSELFEVHENEFRIKGWIAEGAEWLVADACDPKLRARIGYQDLLLANNFLIHMKKTDAAACFDKLLKLMKPGGLLVCRASIWTCGKKL